MGDDLVHAERDARRRRKRETTKCQLARLRNLRRELIEPLEATARKSEWRHTALLYRRRVPREPRDTLVDSVLEDETSNTSSTSIFGGDEATVAEANHGFSLRGRDRREGNSMIGQLTFIVLICLRCNLWFFIDIQGRTRQQDVRGRETASSEVE